MDGPSPFPKPKYVWVKCQHCAADIERAKHLANIKFTCFDCKTERRKKRDAEKKAVERRKDYNRAVRVLEAPWKAVSAEELERIREWQESREKRKRKRGRLGFNYK